MAATAIVIVGAGFAWLYTVYGDYGLHVVLQRGVSVWSAVSRDDPRLTRAARLALHGAHATPGSFVWTTRAEGFETAEIPLLVDGEVVDKLYIARIDPAHWRFRVFNHPAGDRDPEAWLKLTGAALVVNGSYFDTKGEPDTPFRSAGRDLGPFEYHSSHAAFVADGDRARLVDLAHADWRTAFAGASDAMVSYPMLLDSAGETRASASQWLANRSFVGQDRSNRIVIGTSVDAVLTLADLARTLKTAPLDLQLALNLDGGPVACQAIRLADYQRRTCGTMEIQAEGDRIWLLQPVFAGGRWGLPVALTVTPK